MTRRTIFLAIATLTIAVLAVAAAALLTLRRHAEAARDAEAETLVRLVARTVADDVYDLDLRGLRQRLRGVRSAPEVREAYVTDPEGVVLADGTRANARRDQRLEDSFGSALVLSRTWMSSREGDSLRWGGPIITADGALLGYVQVTFDRTAAVDTGTVTGRLLGAALLCALAGGGFLWFGLRGQARPVRAPEGEVGSAQSRGDAADEWRRLETERASFEEERRRWQLEREISASRGADAVGIAAAEGRPNREEQGVLQDLAGLKTRLEEEEARRQELERERDGWSAARVELERERQELQASLAAAEREIETARAQGQALSEATREREASQEKVRQEQLLRERLEATVGRLQQEQASVLQRLSETTHEKERLERLLLEIEDEHLREQEVLDQLQAATAIPEAPSAATEDIPPAQVAEAAQGGTRPIAGEPVLDVGRAVSGGADHAELGRLAGIFLESYPRQVSTIRSAIGANDAALLEDTARAMKAELETLGARRAMAAAGRLELLARTAGREEAEEACVVLEAELEQLRPLLVELGPVRGA